MPYVAIALDPSHIFNTSRANDLTLALEVFKICMRVQEKPLLLSWISTLQDHSPTITDHQI